MFWHRPNCFSHISAFVLYKNGVTVLSVQPVYFQCQLGSFTGRYIVGCVKQKQHREFYTKNIIMDGAWTLLLILTAILYWWLGSGDLYMSRKQHTHVERELSSGRDWYPMFSSSRYFQKQMHQHYPLECQENIINWKNCYILGHGEAEINIS